MTERVFLLTDCALPYYTEVIPSNESSYALVSERCAVLSADIVGRPLYEFAQLVLVSASCVMFALCFLIFAFRSRVVFLENGRNWQALKQDTAVKFLLRFLFGGIVFTIFVADPGNAADTYSWFKFFPLFIVQFQALHFITTYTNIWRKTLSDSSGAISNKNLQCETRFLNLIAFVDCLISSLPSQKFVFDNIMYTIHGVLIFVFFLTHFICGVKVFRAFLQSDNELQKMAQNRRKSLTKSRITNRSVFMRLFLMIVIGSLSGMLIGIYLSLSWFSAVNPPQFVTESFIRTRFLLLMPLVGTYMFASFCVACSYIRVKSSRGEILKVEPKAHNTSTQPVSQPIDQV